MGIPKFYRWLSERYPLVNKTIVASEGPPVVDALYLDMNGIIHNCTHANQSEIKLTKDEMIVRMFDYISKLVQIIKPQKLLFMAIDGVAPRAKMNQQRSRRFKAAKERLEADKERIRKGEPLPEITFDSNCITPGTVFMDELGHHLRFFIRKKIAEDPLWQGPRIVFSGHDVPGEGEHKIMEYIRWEKRMPNYQPNQRHCLYGLDADLIMLSLVTHEPHFFLLREVVSYTGGNRGQPAREVLENPCAENFVLFHIGLLREYLELEFAHVPTPGFSLDIERIVDDFVLFCMLIGNDFLPALPTLDINEGALNNIMTIYKELLPVMGGYITYAGELDRGRLEMLLARVASMELEVLEERAADAEFFENKKRKNNDRAGRATGKPPPPAPKPKPPPKKPAASGFSVLGEDGEETAGADGEEEEGESQSVFGALEEDDEDEPAAPAEPTMMSREARQLMLSGLGVQGLELWKNRWYSEKLGLQPDQRRIVVQHYIEGLHWVLEYYYRGVASWNWFYPHHHAPMASDMVNLSVIEVSFTQGKPFRPFEQLLGVLPAPSSGLLPAPYKPLMEDATSPIIDFYPLSFEVDMEGKRAAWEGVVKIPFVDEARLLSAADLVTKKQLSPSEAKRNEAGHILVFVVQPGSQDREFCQSTLPKVFKDVIHPNSQVWKRPMPPPLPAGSKGFVPELVPGTTTGVHSPLGFSTLKTMKVHGCLRNVGVNVLGMPSRKESYIVILQDLRTVLPDINAAAVAPILLGARCFVNWPHLQEALIVRISDEMETWKLAPGKKQHECKQWDSYEATQWMTESAQLCNSMLTRCGIDVGRCDIIVHVKMCRGYLRHPDGTIQRQLAPEEANYPLQGVIRERPASMQSDNVADEPKKEDLKEGSQAIFLGKQHFGCVATILPSLGDGLNRTGKTAKKGGKYRVAVQPLGVPTTSQFSGAADPVQQVAKRMVKQYEPQYVHSSEVARRKRFNPRMMGRITGNVWFTEGADRYNLGLLVKEGGRGLCVPGYMHPTPDGNGWMYSNAMVKVLEDYREKHGWVLDALEAKTSSSDPVSGSIRLAEVFPQLDPEERRAKALAVVKWVKSLPLANRPLVKTSVQIMMEEGVQALQRSMPYMKPQPPVEFESVSADLLLPPYKPGPDQLKSFMQGGHFELGDRVVSVLKEGVPPFGLHGTVIGVYDEALEVLFDAEFVGGGSLNGRVFGKYGAYVEKDFVVNTTTCGNTSKPVAPRPVSARAPPAETPAPKLLARPASASVAATNGRAHAPTPTTPPAPAFIVPQAQSAAAAALQQASAASAAKQGKQATTQPQQQHKVLAMLQQAAQQQAAKGKQAAPQPQPQPQQQQQQQKVLAMLQQAAQQQAAKGKQAAPQPQQQPQQQPQLQQQQQQQQQSKVLAMLQQAAQQQAAKGKQAAVNSQPPQAGPAPHAASPPRPQQQQQQQQKMMALLQRAAGGSNSAPTPSAQHAQHAQHAPPPTPYTAAPPTTTTHHAAPALRVAKGPGSGHSGGFAPRARAHSPAATTTSGLVGATPGMTSVASVAPQTMMPPAQPSQPPSATVNTTTTTPPGPPPGMAAILESIKSYVPHPTSNPINTPSGPAQPALAPTVQLSHAPHTAPRPRAPLSHRPQHPKPQLQPQQQQHQQQQQQQQQQNRAASVKGEKAVRSSAQPPPPPSAKLLSRALGAATAATAPPPTNHSVAAPPAPPAAPPTAPPARAATSHTHAPPHAPPPSAPKKVFVPVHPPAHAPQQPFLAPQQQQQQQQQQPFVGAPPPPSNAAGQALLAKLKQAGQQ